MKTEKSIKTHSVKKALIASILVLCLCITTLAGTTFAWFTDGVTSEGNIIKTGKLDIDMMWAYGDEDPAKADWEDASTGAIFNSQLWEPGYTEARHINIINKGTLALKYQLLIEPTGEVTDLANVIDVYFIEGGEKITRDGLKAHEPVGTLAKLIKGGITFGSLTAGEDRVFTIVLKMQESAGNEYQEKEIGSSFAIKLLATQYTYESDSISPDYDEDAWHPEMEVYSANDLQSAINNGETNIKLMADIELTEAIVVPAPAATTYSLRTAATVIDLNGNEITSKQISGIAIEIRGAAEIKNGKISTTNGVTGLRATGKSASLTLTDMTVSVTGTGSNAEWNHTAIGAASGATVVINNGTYSAEVGYGLVTMTSGADITINDGTFTTKGTTNSAAVRFDSGWDNSKVYTKAVINGGVFNAPEDGFAFTANNAYGKDITINGGIFNGELDSSYQDNGVVINGGTFNKPILQRGGHQDRYLINGGTFVENVSAKVANGYTAVQNADGTYSVIFPQESFNGLIENAQPGDTIEVPAGEYTFPASKLEAGMTLNCAPGTVFEGKSAMNINGATVIGATFSNPDDVAGAGTINGTFKDCVFEGSEALRWCYAGETVVFENCEFKTDFRGVHFDGMDHDVIFRNCKINGFNAFGGTATVTFEGCTFGCDESRYNGLNMYCNTVLKDCKFEFVSGKTNFIDFEEAGHTLTITNCTATLDGASADVLDFVGGTYKNQTNITVDGARVVSTAAALQSALDNGVAKIALGADLAVTGDNMFTVPTGAAVTIDLNGHNISANFAAKIDGASAVFTINKNASLTINGEGNVHVIAAPTLSYVSSVFTNLGSLEINGGNYSMTYGTYAEGYLIPTIVDTNSNVGKATTVINDGTFTHTRNMFRNFAQPQRGDNNATLIINGGTFKGQADDYATIWNQKTNANGVEGDGVVEINGGDFQYMDICNDFATGVTIAEGLNIAVQP